jgi:hypothetical protein
MGERAIMPTEAEARRYVRLIGKLYGLAIGAEIANEPGEEVTYHQIENLMQPHCTPDELVRVCRELHRFNGIVKRAELASLEEE